jgi:hypothetical protein
MLAPRKYNLPVDLQAIVKDLDRVGVDRTRILEFMNLRKGRVFSWLQLAVWESDDLQSALTTDPDGLLAHVGDSCQYWLLELLVQGEMKRAAILTITTEEPVNLKRFGDVVFSDGTGQKLH